MERDRDEEEDDQRGHTVKKKKHFCIYQFLKIRSFRVELLRDIKHFLIDKLRNVTHLEIFNPDQAGVCVLNENKS